jgi:hypothetical protein
MALLPDPERYTLNASALPLSARLVAITRISAP